MNIKIGDIILFDYKFTGIMNFIDKNIVSPIDGKINHVAIYAGDNTVYESMEGKGVVDRKITLHSENIIYVLRPIDSENVTEKDIKNKLEQFFKSTNGNKYGYIDWVNSGIGRLTKKLFNKAYYPFANQDKKYICSEYAREFWRKGFNIDLTNGKMIPSPNDLYNFIGKTLKIIPLQ